MHAFLGRVRMETPADERPGIPSPSYQHVGKSVCIRCRDKSAVHGTVYSIDPEHGTWLLTTNSDMDLSESKLHAVFASEIVDIDFLATDSVVTVVPTIGETLADEQGGLGLTKRDVMGLLERHHLPYTEEDGEVVRVLGTVTIRPPYRSQNCLCGNEIMLRRVQTMLEDAARPP